MACQRLKSTVAPQPGCLGAGGLSNSGARTAGPRLGDVRLLTARRFLRFRRFPVFFKSFGSFRSFRSFARRRFVRLLRLFRLLWQNLSASPRGPPFQAGASGPKTPDPHMSRHLALKGKIKLEDGQQRLILPVVRRFLLDPSHRWAYERHWPDLFAKRNPNGTQIHSLIRALRGVLRPSRRASRRRTSELVTET